MKKLVILFLAVVVCCVFLAGCATVKSQSKESDIDAIKQIWMNYVTAVENGDATAWLAQWDKDGIQMRPDAPQRTKQELDASVPAGFKARVDANDVKMMINPLEITVAGPWVYSRGLYTLDLTNKTSGVITHIDGKFLTILKKQADGTWKIYRDCFNSNVPPK
jgi:ketosteroid isomerase-like protein